MENHDEAIKGRGVVGPTPTNHPYTPPKEGKIAIVAYNPTPWKTSDVAYTPTVEAFNKIIECGFNAAMMRTGKTTMSKDEAPGLLDSSLACMEGLDIRAVVVASSYCAVPYPIENQSSAQTYYDVMVYFINKYKVNPIIWGWMIRDEPLYINLFGFDNPENVEILRGEQDISESFQVYNSNSNKITFFNLACSITKDRIRIGPGTL